MTDNLADMQGQRDACQWDLDICNNEYQTLQVERQNADNKIQGLRTDLTDCNNQIQQLQEQITQLEATTP